MQFFKGGGEGGEGGGGGDGDGGVGDGGGDGGEGGEGGNDPPHLQIASEVALLCSTARLSAVGR